MSAAQPSSQSERIRAAIREFDRQRRLSANRFIVIAFLALLGGLSAFFTLVLLQGALHGNQIAAGWIVDGVFGFCILLYCFSLWANWARRLSLANIIAVAATNLAVVLSAILWIFVLSPAAQRANPVTYGQLISLNITILLAGALSEWLLTILTTLLMNALAIFFIIAIPIQDASHIFLPLVLVQQWGMAVITLAVAALYRRTLVELGRAYIQAQELEQLKDQFITNVNHELRTPVMTLQGYVEYMRLALGQMTPESMQESLNRASRTGYSLLTLLNSILDVRRIDGEDHRITPVPLLVYPLIQQAIDLIDPRDGVLDKRELTIDVPLGLELLGEPIRVQQILTNLISNALKYSDAGTPIQITAQRVLAMPPQKSSRHFAQRPQPMCEILVRDAGFGIPPDQMPLLFNRFARLPRDLASRVIGNGLGLYLCRVLSEAMGGWIWAESSGVPGEGTTFHVCFPLAERAGGPTTSPRLLSQAPKRPVRI